MSEENVEIGGRGRVSQIGAAAYPLRFDKVDKK
jgi:hypothetical protein